MRASVVPLEIDWIAKRLRQFFRTERPLGARLAAGTLHFVKSKPMGAFGAAMLILIVIVGIFSPWIAKDSVLQANLGDSLQGPTAEHWFGTDWNGRDLFSRIIYGAQVTALVGLGTVLFVMVLSLLVGVSSGYFGGKLDFFVQRFVDIWLSFPAIFLILTLLAC